MPNGAIWIAQLYLVDDLGLLPVDENNHNQNKTNLQSQITSTKKIMHVINWNEALIIARESDKTTRWICEAVKIRQESQGVMNRDEGPTTSMTVCCSPWRPLAEDSKQQFGQNERP